MADGTSPEKLVIRNQAARFAGVYIMASGPLAFVIINLIGIVPSLFVIPVGVLLVIVDPIAGYLAFVRPHLVCDGEGITLQRPVRRHVIPWSEFRGVRPVPRGGRQSLGISCADGTTVTLDGISNSALSRPRLSDAVRQVQEFADRYPGSSSGPRSANP